MKESELPPDSPGAPESRATNGWMSEKAWKSAPDRTRSCDAPELRATKGWKSGKARMSEDAKTPAVSSRMAGENAKAGCEKRRGKSRGRDQRQASARGRNRPEERGSYTATGDRNDEATHRLANGCETLRAGNRLSLRESKTLGIKKSLNLESSEGSVIGISSASPNEPKLSDSGVRRGTCMVGGKAAAEAGAVTHGAVRCSAWLGLIGRP